VRVMKFGGSSVADAARIRAVIDIVTAAAATDHVLLVFSAMKGITDQLLTAAEQAAAGNPEFRQQSDQIRNRHLEVIDQLLPGAPVSRGQHNETSPTAAVTALCGELAELLHGVSLVRECSPRTRDLIVSHGERLNCLILTAAFSLAGLDARMIDGRDIVRTDSTHGSASVDFKSTYALMRERLSPDPAPGDRSGSANPVAVITGFIASDTNGVTTTLGRNGSDYTASLVGAALDADAIEIWTDVDGVYSADPRFVRSAAVLDSVSYREAMELSYFGAEVIHPFTMLPAVEKGIPLLIRNTMNPSAPGTVIADKTSAHAGLITGIASIESVALINVEGGGMVGLSGVAGRVFSALATAMINIIMISQASSEHSICFVVRDYQAGPAVAVLESELELELHQKKIERVQVQRDLEIVAVIGENMKGRPGISGRLFGALGDVGINVLAIAQGSTEMNISFVVPRSERKKALNAVHAAFFPGET
jgi:bifunctional aspartokinase / homoserine dehydrogenase 1